jgi:hypothetical protein
MPHSRESGGALGRKRRRNVKPFIVKVEGRGIRFGATAEHDVAALEIL